MENQKIVLDWKVMSTKKIKEVVGKLDNEKKRDFAVNCIEKVNNKNTVNKKKTREWLNNNCKDMFSWKNEPKNSRAKSSVDEMAEWANL